MKRRCVIFLTLSVLAQMCLASPRSDLYDATKRGDVTRVAAMLQEDASLASLPLSDDGVAGLHLASALNQRDIMRLFLLHGSPVDIRTANGFTPLHWAASRDSVDAINILLGKGADMNATTPHGITALHWAGNNNSTNALRILLDAGANVFAETSAGQTPLHWAVTKDATLASVILAQAMVDEADERGISLLTSQPAMPPPETVTTQATAFLDVIPRPVFGSFLRVPIGRSQNLAFVWIEELKMWFSKYEVTNGQYRRAFPHHTSLFRESLSLDHEDQPAVYVSWLDAMAFCRWLNKNCEYRLPPDCEYALPTVEEWQYVAGANGTRVYPWGNTWPPAYGNYSDLAASNALPNWVGIDGYNDGHAVSCAVFQSGTDERGIYGLSGNVWEWCEDWHGTGRVHKARCGGSWDFVKEPSLRVSAVGFDLPDAKDDTIGFRVVVRPRREQPATPATDLP